jgi:cyclopropane fatty-acyl-phospholipid synthase-like methyltransferase
MIQHFDPSSIAYFEENSDQFIAGTVGVDMGELYEPFLRHIPQGGRILDLGCGSGRDTKFFAENFYEVIALDASSEMVAATRSLVDAEVHQMRFDEMDYTEEFDGIWACASLLHVPEQALKDIMQKCLSGLRAGGAMFQSFKYGTSERATGGRLFTDLDEKKLETLLSTLEHNLSVTHWITSDARPNRSKEKWLNAVLIKELKKA